MSKRATEHNMRLSDTLLDLVSALSFGGTVLTASPDNHIQVNAAITLFLSAVQSWQLTGQVGG